MKQLEYNKAELVRKVEERLEMGWKANEDLLSNLQLAAANARSEGER